MILILVMLVFGGCVKDQPPVPDPTDNPKDTIFELVWETRIDTANSVIGSDYVQLWNDWFICTGDISEPLTLYGFDKHTGKKDWTYVHQGELRYKIIYNKLIGDIYIGMTNDGIFGFDLNTKTVIWEINLSNMNISRGWNMTTRGDYIYLPCDLYRGNIIHSVSKILRVKYDTGEYETVFEKKSADSLMNGFSSPVFWTNPDTGHDIMFFNNGNWNYQLPPQKIDQDMIAVDVVTKEVIWKNAAFSSVATNRSIPPVTYQDNVITGGDWSIYSFDARTGELRWKREFADLKPFGLWNTTQHLVEANRIYVNEVAHNIWCLDVETGAVIWHNNNDAPNCTPTMTYYQDMLVYTSWGYGSIMVLDAFTGKQIHRERSHNGSTFNTDVIYDPQTDMFFTTDYHYAYGFRIRKPK